MTIEKAIAENMGEQVKIGFGSSFVYCDRVTRETIDIMAKLSDEYLERLKLSLKGTLSRFRGLINKGEETFIQEMISKEDREHVKPHHTWDWWSLEYYRRIGNVARHIEKLKVSIDKYVPFLEAKVHETYPSIDEDALIIISKDNPCVVGSYWTIDEYRRGLGQIEVTDYE